LWGASFAVGRLGNELAPEATDEAPAAATARRGCLTTTEVTAGATSAGGATEVPAAVFTAAGAGAFTAASTDAFTAAGADAFAAVVATARVGAAASGSAVASAPASAVLTSGDAGDLRAELWPVAELCTAGVVCEDVVPLVEAAAACAPAAAARTPLVVATAAGA
jgi:hypothetical protein